MLRWRRLAWLAAATSLIRPQLSFGVVNQRRSVANNLSDIECLLSEHELYDAEIVAHGFLPYLRDYQLLVERIDNAPLGLFEYTFEGCMEVRYAVTLPPSAISMDPRLIEIDASEIPDGFVWSVGSVCSAEEGTAVSETSDRAVYWTERLGRPMFEIEIGTNVFALELVFHSLSIRRAVENAGVDRAPDV